MLHFASLEFVINVFVYAVALCRKEIMHNHAALGL